MRLDTALGEAPIQFERGLVQAQLDHRKVRRGGFQEFGKTQAGHRDLGLAQLLEGLAEMEEHQIALVADERIDNGLLHGAQRGGRFFESRIPLGGGEGFPGCPAEPHHLVQDAGSFKGQWNGG